MKYSVIIPAYQAENTIARCLDSLLAGIRSDTEILVVNDGSTDRTEAICRDYAQRHPQICWFSQAHTGVSGARNLALDHAAGRFVLFVDSDDYVSPDYFPVIDQNLSGDTDLLMFGKSVFDGNTMRACPLRNHRTKNADDSMQFLGRALVRQKMNALYTKVFRRDMLVKYGIRFDERLPIGEDKVFVVRYLVHVQNAVCIKEPLYVLSVENDRSLSRKKRENLCDYILLEHQLLFEAVEQSDYHSALMRAVSFSYYRSAYTVIRELRKFGYSRARRLELTRQICRRYAARQDGSWHGLHHWLLSVPIRLELVELIDFVLRRKL